MISKINAKEYSIWTTIVPLIIFSLFLYGWLFAAFQLLYDTQRYVDRFTILGEITTIDVWLGMIYVVVAMTTYLYRTIVFLRGKLSGKSAVKAG